VLFFCRIVPADAANSEPHDWSDAFEPPPATGSSTIAYAYSLVMERRPPRLDPHQAAPFTASRQDTNTAAQAKLRNGHIKCRRQDPMQSPDERRGH
jgi:hypothetical protein